MIKLYIDDIRDAPDGSWVLARTITDAIRMIDNWGWEIVHISIDHDISHNVEVDEVQRPFPCKENFTAVARYIVACFVAGKLDHPDLKVTIHSANPVGRQQILSILDEAHITHLEEPMPPCNRFDKGE